MSLDQELLDITPSGLCQELGLPPELVEIWNNNPELILSLLNRRGPLLTFALSEYLSAEHATESTGDVTYRLVLLAFEKFMTERWMGTPKETWTVDRINRNDVDAFVTRRKANGSLREATTCNKDLAIVRAFMWWLLEAEHVHTNCTAKMKRQKEPARLPVALTPDEQQRVLRLCKEGREGERNYTLVHLCLNAGLRANEAVGLTWDKFDLKAGWLTVVGKGQKERSVPLLPAVITQLEEYRDKYWRHELPAPNAENHVFRNSSGRHWGKPMTVDGAENMFARIMAKIGRPRGQNLHVLRHTFAINLVVAGVHVVYIKKLLGHSLLATTGAYTKVADTELARVMATHFPSGVLVPRAPQVDFNPEVQQLIDAIMEE